MSATCKARRQNLVRMLMKLVLLLNNTAGWMGSLVRDLWGSANWEVFTSGVREWWSIRFLNLTLWVHLLDNSVLLGLTLLCSPAFTLHNSYLRLLFLGLSPRPFDLVLHLRKVPLRLFPPLSLLLSLALPLSYQRCYFELIEVFDHLEWLRVLPRPLGLDDLLKHVVQ